MFSSPLESAPKGSSEPEKSTPLKPKVQASSLGKTLLAAGALHAGLAGAVYAGPTIKSASEQAVHTVQEYAEPRIERWRITRERGHMLEEAREAREQHRPWAGRFLVHSWFLEKRAAHELYNDEAEIQRAYAAGLRSLRHELDGKPLTPQNIQQAFHHVFSRFDYWGGGGEGHMVDFLREHGGNCAMAGPLAAAYMEDLGIPGGGLRLIAANPLDEVPLGHIEATLPVRTENGTTYDHGLQRGHRMGTNGVHVRTHDLLNFYRPGSISLYFPAARTEEELRPDPPNNATLTPFGEGSFADYNETNPSAQRSDEGTGQTAEAHHDRQSQEARISSEIALVRSLTGIERFPYLGDIQVEVPSSQVIPTERTNRSTRFSWEAYTIQVHTLTNYAQEVKTSLNQTDRQQHLAAIYASLSELHEYMRLQAALEGRNSASRRFLSERDRFIQESHRHLPQHLQVTNQNQEEIGACIRNSTEAAQTFFSDLQNAWGLVSAVEDQGRIFSDLLLLLKNARDIRVLHAVFAWTNQLIQNPFMKSLFFQRLGFTYGYPLADRSQLSQLTQQWKMSLDFSVRMDSDYLRSISSAAALEQDLQREFTRQNPSETYDISYFFVHFQKLVGHFELPDPRNYVPGSYAQGIRDQQELAQESLRVIRLYEQDTRFPAGYISQLIQLGENEQLRFPPAIERAERDARHAMTRAGGTIVAPER